MAVELAFLFSGQHLYRLHSFAEIMRKDEFFETVKFALSYTLILPWEWVDCGGQTGVERACKAYSTYFDSFRNVQARGLVWWCVLSGGRRGERGWNPEPVKRRE